MEQSENMTASSKNSLWGMDYIRRMYDWIMSWAEHKYGSVALCGISAIESIFFPLPVDPLLIAMGAAKPKKAIIFALITTVGSVIGAFFGYQIGIYFWEAGAQELFYQYVFSPEKMDLVMKKFQENGFISIFIAGFTPIPFKVFTISAGVAKLDLVTFMAASFVGRGARFFLVGGLMYFFGASVKKFIDDHFAKLTLGLGGAIVLAFAIYKYFA